MSYQKNEKREARCKVGLSSVIVLLVVALVMVTVACRNQQATSDLGGTYQKISAQTAQTLLQERPDAILIDVRTEAEYLDGHIAGALLLPNEQISSEHMPAELPDLNAPLILYCRSGNRSNQAAKKLLKLGYQEIYDLGAVSNWKQPLVRW